MQCDKEVFRLTFALTEAVDEGWAVRIDRTTA